MTDQIVKPIRRTLYSNLDAWALAGYRVQQNVRSRVVQLDLADVQSFDPLNGELLRFVSDGPARIMEVISGYPFDDTKREIQDTPVDVRLRRFIMGDLFDVTDVAWSARSSRHYVLDSTANEIIVVPQTYDEETLALRRIPLTLPVDVTLDPGSRLTVLPREQGREELVDPLFFVSAPDAGVVLRVDRESGEAAIAAGQTRTQHRTRSDTAERPTFVRPSGVSIDVDGSESRLIVFDPGTQRVSAVGLQSRNVEVIATGRAEPRRLASGDGGVYVRDLMAPLGGLIYRLMTFHVDSGVIGKPAVQVRSGWGALPAILVSWNAAFRMFAKPLNFNGAVVSMAGYPGVRGLRPLPSGELVAFGAKVWHLQHPVALFPEIGTRLPGTDPSGD